MIEVLTLRGTVGYSINDMVVQDFLKKANGSNIEVRIHTLGGSVFEGNLIYNSFKNYQGKKTLIIEGVCASMGTIIMGSFDEVQIVSNGLIMIHTPYGYTEGNAAAHESGAKLLRLMEKNFKEVYKTRTEADLDKLMDGNDHWYDAEEALANGFVDAIIVDEIPFDIPKVEGSYKALFAKSIDFIKANATNIQFTNNQNQINMKNLVAILMTLGFALTIESTEAQAIDAIKAKFKEQDDEIARLKAELTKQSKEAKEASLKQALSLGRINQEQYKHLAKVAEKLASPEDVEDMLKSIPAPTSIASQVDTTISDDKKGWTWDDYQAKASSDLEKMESTNPELYKSLFKAKYGSEPSA